MTASSTTYKSSIIIDSRVTDWQNLIEDVPPYTTIHLLDESRDGLIQIAEVVKNISNLKAIHIISHGNAGSMLLGSTVLDTSNINNYQSQLSAIGNTLTTNGDILLYGCEVALGNAGQQFIKQLATLTGATVAASSTLTGNTALGGDWLLDVSTGAIRTQALSSDTYQHILNLAPNLTAFNSNVATGFINKQITIGFNTLLADSNAADSDGSVTAFVVTAIDSGTLLIGTDPASAKAWVAGTNDTIDSTHFAYWVPNTNASGTLNAFRVIAKDNGGALSMSPAVQATVSLSIPPAPAISGLDPAHFTEGSTATLIDNAVLFTGGTSYGGGYVSYSLANANTADQMTLTSSANPTAVGEVSFSNGTVYLGNGTGVDPIGSIDSVQNGVNGQALKINFSSSFANPSFEASWAGAGSPVTGWNIGTSQVMLGTTMIGGWLTPNDPALPNPIGTNNSVPVVDPNQSFTYSFIYDVASVGSNSPNSGGTGGSSSLHLYSLIDYTLHSYDVVNGPYAESSVFHASAGDTLYFDWMALGGPDTNYNDAYDVFGYLLNTTTGATTIVLNQTGANANSTTPWATVGVNVPTTGNYEFVFVSGSWDATGGHASGGSLYVDNLRVYNNGLNDGVVQKIVQQIAYQNTATDAPVTRALTLTVANGEGSISTVATTLNITNINNQPVFNAGATLATTNSNSNPSGATVASLFTSHYTDLDNVYTPTDSLAGIAISSDASTASQGVWQYSTDTGNTWNNIGTVSNSSALLLNLNTLVRFLPSHYWSGTPGSLSVHAVDNSAATTFSNSATHVFFDTTTDPTTSPVSHLAVTLGTSIVPVPQLSPVTITYPDTAFVDTFPTATDTLQATGINIGDILTYGIQGGINNGNGTISKSNNYGILTVNSTTGAYNFVANSAVIEPLGADVTDTNLVVTATDQNNLIDSQAFTLIITVVGTTETNGNDNLVGTTGNDNINALAGDDTINGGAGADTMNGNLGNDTYYLDNTGDVVIENAGVGTGWDIVNSSITYTLLTNAEGLILIGTAAINGTGNTTDNRIIGNSVNNIIDGGTGADWMTGGAGNDTYHVDNTGDRIDEAANEGWDTVWTAINHTLSANVEMLRMDSGAANLNGYGNTINNYMVGNDGNNILDGQSGADTMTGGLGDDSYYVDNISDVITELTGQGTDTIYASISFDLANAPNVENLSLTGTEAINATGNGTGNRLTGNSADNIISDGGATVAATMIGGAGNDTYNVNNTADLITENENSGWDIVNSSVSYTLSSNVDALVLTGTASTNATGNANDNRIIGNSADNIINGGVGADWMAGETGNDTYNVDNVSDRVDESYYQGWDVIWTSVTYTLPINIEALWMNPSAGNIIGYGNVQYNFLVGNEGNNLLDGQAGCDTLVGGLGADTLIGGLGQDLYDLSEATASTDTIRVAAGDSPASIGNYDYAIGFKLGTGTINTVGVDQLDLVNTTIASNASNVNGIDSGPIMSHQINNGIISFDSSDTHTSPLAISEGYLGLIFDYLHNNITGGQTVGFVCSANTYVYQAGSTASTTDTLVELVGVSATSLSTTGLAANAVWIV